MDRCSQSPRENLLMSEAGRMQPKGTDPCQKPPQLGLAASFAQRPLPDLWPTRLLSPSLLAPQTCGSKAFHCQQGGCIATDRVCDGTADCRAGEDEDKAKCGEHWGGGRLFRWQRRVLRWPGRKAPGSCCPPAVPLLWNSLGFQRASPLCSSVPTPG